MIFVGFLCNWFVILANHTIHYLRRWRTNHRHFQGRVNAEVVYALAGLYCDSHSALRR
jgi:hypothetical protein